MTTSRIKLVLSLVAGTLLGSLMLSGPAYAKTDSDFDVRPAPAWVDHLDAETKAATPRSDVRFGLYQLLDDNQVRVDNTTVDYRRKVRKVLSPSGVQNASELGIDFDPSYQRLVIHEVTLMRDGKSRNALDIDAVRVIQKEDDSNQKIYDGMLTALIILNDVRPEDIIDYSYSLEGANPILAGRFADEYDVTSTIPAHLIRRRLLWPTARPLHIRSTIPSLQPKITQRGTESEFVWTRHDVAGLDVEDDIPDWFDPYDHIEVSDFSSWAEVARWADALFQADPKSLATVKTLAAKIRAEHPSRPDQIVAATRFVQDDVRYLGIEMGRNSHEPHQPAAVLEQRWGDCKDKAFLLATLLRELGIQAYPALVNTKLHQSLDSRLPSPFLFDHVIVQVLDGGKVRWIDGTISDQGGTLETMETPSDERGLVVRKETTALATIRTPSNGGTVVEQTYTSEDYEKPTKLLVKTTYTGGDADEARSSLASMSINDLAKEHLNRYAGDQPKIKANGLPQITDDRVRNVIVITEHYTIRELWKNGEWSWYPRLLEQHIHRPETMIRSMPLAFEYPMNIRQRLTFNLPEHLDLEAGHQVIEDGTFHYEYKLDSSGHTVTIEHSLHALRNSVAVADVPDHLTKLNDVWDKVGYQLSPNIDQSSAASTINNLSGGDKWAWGLGSLLFIVGIASVIAIPRARREHRLRPIVRGNAFLPGEAPVAALAVRDAEELRARLSELACRCGATLQGPADLQQARYEESEMTIATRHCANCGREQSIYFRDAAAAQTA